MLQENKFAAMVDILLLLQILLFQSEIFVDATIRNDKPGISKLEHEMIKEHSSDQLSVKDSEKEKPENNQLYYLPTQTMFGESNIQVSQSGLSTTSPPRMSIDPAPIQTSYVESTNILNKDHSAKEVHYYKDPYQCVSETPAIQLESQLLLPSSNLIKQSVIMSGHLEIVSKTSTVEDASEVGPMVSRPSIVVQGTVLESHPIRDL